MKIKLALFSVMLFFTSTFANPNAQGEMWIRVSNYQDILRGGVTITVYNSSWQFVDDCVTSSTPVENQGNAFMYMAGEPISNPNASYVIGPLNYNSTYYFVIDNKYAQIHIGAHTGTPDEHLRFQNNTFSLNSTHHIFNLVSQANWNPKTVTVKNSFSAGNVKIDGTLHQNIGSGGITKSFGEPTFPHTLEAINNQSYDNYLRKYQNWSKNDSYYGTNKIALITAVSATYTANFLKEYNLTFKNSFVGAGNGGEIKVEGSPVGSPTGVYPITENDPQGISFEAVNQTINGIAYTFAHWENGSTVKSRTEYPNNHKNYIASFNGKPVGVGNSVTFNSGAPAGTPIKLYWNDNVNPTVKYKIYRKHGKFGSTELIATVNSGVETYTDYSLAHTNNTSSYNLTKYDVRAYYPTENSYATPYFKAVYAELFFKQNGKKGDSTNTAITMVKENSITNFPNPFNPTTIVYYKLKEQGDVVIKVYDMLGKEIAELVNEKKSMGEYVASFNGSNLSSGVYIMTMQTNNFLTSKKILLTK